MGVTIIRKVNLTMKENYKYEVIKKLVETNGNKNNASLKLGCTRRHINRLIVGYKSEGKEFFVHGNHFIKPSTTISNDVKENVLSLYKSKYYDCNITHFKELLMENENIDISISSISSLLKANYILSPKAHRKTKKAMKKELEMLSSKKSTTKKHTEVMSSLLSLEDAHPRRPRSALFGEMIQMDASEFFWFGGIKTHLHIAVDDATGMLVGAYFDTQETLNGYYNVLYQILNNYGIPYQFFTDRRTVFDYKRKDKTDLEKDTFTQFSYACHQLGIDIKTSSVPQAKGRVEKMNATLQSRLSAELRLNNVSSIDEANKFLISYKKKFNKRFALPINNTKSCFELQPSKSKINLILSVISTRKIDNGCAIKYHNKYYLPIDSACNTVHHRKGTVVLVIKAFDNKLYTTIGDKVYALKCVSKRAISPNFSQFPTPKKQKTKYIPPSNHPWKRESFESFLRKNNPKEYVAI